MLILVCLVLYTLIGPAFFQGQIDTFSYLGVLLISVAVAFYIFKIYSQKIFTVLFVGYIIRLLFLFIDFEHLMPIIHSGADSEMFFSLAKDNLGTTQKNFFSNYIIFLSYLFEITGPERLFAQYINVLAGFGTMIYIDKCLVLFSVDNRIRVKAMWATALMPHLIIFSAILLRESILILFAIMSLYFLLKWTRQKKAGSMIASLSLILGSTFLHSGMIGLFVGFIFIFISYQHSSQKLLFKSSSLIPLAILLPFSLLLLLKTDLFTGYFQSFFDIESGGLSEELLLDRFNSKEDAGSAYLQGLNYSSFWSILVYMPLKVFYFLFSPMPWEWRGTGDILAFILDAPFYFFTLTYIYYSRKKIKYTTINPVGNLTKALMISFWFSIMLYSYGTSTSGTAMRHRANFFPMLVVIAAIHVASFSSDRKEKQVGYR